MDNLGLVLAGGAARGAYAAGVMRFLYLDLPRRLGFVPWATAVSGTSVGALNGAFAASHSAAAVQRLVQIWQEMRIPDVYLLGAGALRAARSLLKPAQSASLLDASPLHRLVRREAPIQELRAAIDGGSCRAFVVSTTQLETGFNTLFLDSADPGIDLLPAPGNRAARVKIGPEHLLASSALPFLFPSVEVDGVRYVDGGLRQNTPIRPILRSGIDRVLLVGAHVAREVEGAPRAGLTPSLPFLAGKTFNALMLDPVERDLHNVEQVNAMIAWGRRRYGERFAAEIQRDLGVQEVDILFLRPDQDLGRVASSIYRSRPPQVSPQMRMLLSLVADQANSGESDLLSYLYFDREYTNVLLEMGYEHARAREEVIAHFLLRGEPEVHKLAG